MLRLPVIVSPDLRTFSDAAPINAAVILFAEKLPELSRDTIVLAVLTLVASVATFTSLYCL